MTTVSPPIVVSEQHELAERLSAEMDGQARRFTEAAERLAGLLHTGRVRRRSGWLCRHGASVTARAAGLVSGGKGRRPSC